jgi:hypothetical protein
VADGIVPAADERPASTLALLAAAEKRICTPDQVRDFVNRLFDGVLGRLNKSAFADYFELATIEHASFQEEHTREFIIRTLAGENRPDNLVNARVLRVRKPQPWDKFAMLMSAEYDEKLILELNCRVDRVQLRLTLTPRFKSLKRFILVLTCAPSLEQCYVFEALTLHPLTSWESFDERGKELVQRWYKIGWTDNLEGLTSKLCATVEETVIKHVQDTSARLATI